MGPFTVWVEAASTNCTAKTIHSDRNSLAKGDNSCPPYVSNVTVVLKIFLNLKLAKYT